MAAQQPSRLAASERGAKNKAGPLKGCAEAPTAGCWSWNRWRRTAFPALARNVKGLVAVCHPGLDVWDLSGPRLASHSRLQSQSAEKKDGVISLQTSPTVKVLRPVPASAPLASAPPASAPSLYWLFPVSPLCTHSLAHSPPQLADSLPSSALPFMHFFTHSLIQFAHPFTHEAFDQRLLWTGCCLGC